MKNQSTLKLLTLVTFISIANSTKSMAGVDSVDLIQDIAAAKTAIVSLHRSTGVGTTVAQVRTLLSEKQKEVVTERHTNESSSQKSAQVGAWIVSFGYNSSRYDYESYDVTKILSTSAEEVAFFEADEKADFRSLQVRIQDHLESNKEGLTALKEWGIYLASLAVEAIQNDVTIDVDDVMDTLYKAASLTFVGEQYTARCVSTQYADRSSVARHSLERHAEASFLFVSGEASMKNSSRQTWNQYAHKETKCSETSYATQMMEASDGLYSVDFQKLDQQLNTWIRSVEATKLQLQAPKFQSFGSPYFKN